ncbi:MFS transporter [Streptomyces sp. BH106]|uniref:MFS transporter n=1 Tax=Streptomyces sp. BH106 TaxID=3410409 RepID=UPI003CEC5D0E
MFPHSRSVRAWTVTGVLLLFVFVNFADKAALGLVAEPLTRELGLSNSEFGLLSSAFYFLFSASSIAVGLFGTRLRAGWLLAGCAVLWSLAQLPFVFSAGLAVLLLARVVLGAAEGPGVPLAMATAFSWFPATRRTLPSGLLLTGTGLGVMVASPALTWVAGHYGWRSVFTVLAAAGAVWLALWMAFGGVGPYATAPAPRTGPGATRADLRAMLRSRTWWACVVGMFAMAWGTAVMTSWLPLFMIRALGYSSTQMGLANSAFWAVFTVGCLGVGVLADRLLRRGAGPRQARLVPGAIVLLLSAVAMAVLPVMGGGPPALLVILVLLPWYGLFMPLAQAAIADIAPDAQRTRALLIGTGLGQLSALAGPYVVGVLLDAAPDATTGYRHALWLSAALLVAGAVGVLALGHPERERWRAHTPPAADNSPNNNSTQGVVA